MAEEMRPVPKNPPYRNMKLRELAKDAPHCMWCKKPNDGSVVLAHSNRETDGKGMGVKAHDIPCYLCHHCHGIVDGRLEPNGWTWEERDEIIREAAYYSTLWLLQEGHLVVK